MLHDADNNEWYLSDADVAIEDPTVVVEFLHQHAQEIVLDEDAQCEEFPDNQEDWDVKEMLIYQGRVAWAFNTLMDIYAPHLRVGGTA